MHTLKIKRIYDPPEATDGSRILVDRLWPRGIKKIDAKIDLWLKDIAPSTTLREWFNHEPEKWENFQITYAEELKNNPSTLQEILKRLEKTNVTLLYASKELRYNNAIALKNYILTYLK